MCSSKHVKKQKPTYYHGFSHSTFRDNDISTISVTTFTFSLFIHPGLNSAPIMSSVEDEMRSRSPSQAQHRPHLSLNLMFWFFTYWHSIEKLNLTVSNCPLTHWLSGSIFTYLVVHSSPWWHSLVPSFSSPHSWWTWTWWTQTWWTRTWWTQRWMFYRGDHFSEVHVHRPNFSIWVSHSGTLSSLENNQ